MLDALLSGSIFWLPSDGFIPARQLARGIAERWSGSSQVSETSGGVMLWTRRTAISFAGHAWFAEPATLTGDAFQMIAPLGSIGAVEAFAFVTPFSSIRASFAAAFRGELFEKWGFPGRGEFVLDEARLGFAGSHKALPSGLVEVEASDTGGRGFVIGGGAEEWRNAAVAAARPRTLHVASDLHHLRVHSDFSFEIDGVSDACETVAASLRWFFETYRSFAVPVHVLAQAATSSYA